MEGGVLTNALEKLKGVFTILSSKKEWGDVLEGVTANTVY